MTACLAAADFDIVLARWRMPVPGTESLKKYLDQREKKEEQKNVRIHADGNRHASLLGSVGAQGQHVNWMVMNGASFNGLRE